MLHRFITELTIQDAHSYHVISDDVTNVHNFSLLFGIREIPLELGLKVKASPSSLCVFATPEEAANESYFGDRLDHFCFLLESNRREASELLEACCFTFKENSSMFIFSLRVNLEEKLLLDSMGSEVINSTGGGANKLKQRNKETKLVGSFNCGTSDRFRMAARPFRYSSSYQHASW
jgi:hypothetical protein